MKKQLLKTMLLFLLSIQIVKVSNAQRGWPFDNSNSSTASSRYSDEVETSTLDDRMAQIAEASSAMNSIEESTGGPRLRIRTTDAPPDCPECNPDPGGGVVDVPFDKRLLIILFVASVFVIKKVYK
jgi:hypothetical protein